MAEENIDKLNLSIKNPPDDRTAEEKLEGMMGDLENPAGKNVSLDPLEKRIKGKENKKFDDQEEEPKDRSKVTEGNAEQEARKSAQALLNFFKKKGTTILNEAPAWAHFIGRYLNGNWYWLKEGGSSKDSAFSAYHFPQSEKRETIGFKDSYGNKKQSMIFPLSFFGKSPVSFSESVEVPSGSAVAYVQKNMDMFSRALGQNFYASGVPISFIREGRTFSGIFLFGDNYHLLLEFTAGPNGDILTSISKYAYDMVSEQADWTVNFDQPDLQSNLENVSLLLKDSLKESKKTDVSEFLSTADLSKPKSALHQDYLAWARENDKEGVSEAYFRNVLKNSGSKATSGSPKTLHYQDTFETPVEYDEFEKEIMENDVFYKYEMMGELVKSIVQKDSLYKNVFIYGVGGIGKTYTVEQVIKKYANPGDVVTYKGAIAGFTGLLQVLWENRDGKIIVFDDNDGILTGGQQNAANMLKLAMEMSEPRILTYSRFKRKRESIEWPEEQTEEMCTGNINIDGEEVPNYIDDGDYEDFLDYDYAESTMPLNQLLEGTIFHEASDFDDEGDGFDDFETEAMQMDRMGSSNDFDMEEFKKTYNGDLDPDIDPAFGLGPDDEIPDRFQFNSRIIFISNLMKIPQPLFDRTYAVGLLLTREQILDLIDSKLGNLMSDYPQITLEDKKETLKFMRKYLHRAGKTPTFRGFQQLIALYKSDHPDKMKLMYLSYTAGKEMKAVLK